MVTSKNSYQTHHPFLDSRFGQIFSNFVALLVYRVEISRGCGEYTCEKDFAYGILRFVILWHMYSDMEQAVPKIWGSREMNTCIEIWAVQLLKSHLSYSACVRAFKYFPPFCHQALWSWRRKVTFSGTYTEMNEVWQFRMGMRSWLECVAGDVWSTMSFSNLSQVSPSAYTWINLTRCAIATRAYLPPLKHFTS